MKLFLKYTTVVQSGVRGLIAALLLCFGMAAHSQDASPYANYYGGYDGAYLSIGKADNFEWYGPVHIASPCTVYIEDGAIAKFYGKDMVIEPGVVVMSYNGFNADGSFANLKSADLGTGSIAFIQANPLYNTNEQQTLNGGYSTGSASNTLPAISIDNANGVTLTESSIRIGNNITFTSGHLFVDTHDAVLSPAATITDYDQSKFVVTASTGTLKKEGVNATAFTFPVGYVNAATAYVPATLTNTGTADIFSVRAINPLTPAASATATGYLTNSWEIKEGTAGGSNVQLALQHNSPGNEGSGYASATAQIVASPATSAWAAAVSNATIAAAGTVQDSKLHTINGVTDFSTNTFFSKATAATAKPDLTPDFYMQASSFKMQAPKLDSSFLVVYIGEINNVATDGTIEFRLAKNSSLDITYNPSLLSIQSNGQSTPVSNTDWIFDGSNPTYYSFKTNKVIAAGNYSSFGVMVRANSSVTSTTKTPLTGSIYKGSGGDDTSDNNKTTVTVSVQF